MAGSTSFPPDAILRINEQLATLLNSMAAATPTSEPVAPNVVWRDGGVLTVSVGIPPVITLQPQSQTVGVGDPVTFTVTATNATSYQWRRGGINISGATSTSYTIAETVIGDDAASFDVVITGLGGSVTSDAAVLTVTPAIEMKPPTALPNPYLVALPLSSGSAGSVVSDWPDAIASRDLINNGLDQPLLRIESDVRVVEFASNRRLRYTPASSFNSSAFSMHWLLKPTLPLNFHTLVSLSTDYSGSFFATGWTQDDWVFDGLVTPAKPLNPMGQNRWFLVSVVFNGSTCRFFCDGAEISATSTNAVAGQTALASSRTISELGLAYWAPGGGRFNGRMAYFGFYEAAHTADDVRALRNYLRNEYSAIYAPPSDIVVWLANSLGTSQFTTASSAGQLAVLSATAGSKSYSFVNSSIGGITTPQITNRVTEHYSKYLDAATGRKVAVVWEATNDFAVNGANAATAYANLITLRDSLKLAGFDKVVLAKVIDRNAGGFQAFLTDFASLVDSNSSDWDAIVTPPTELTGADANQDATYFVGDGVHLRATGNDLMAPLFRDAIESVLP